MVKSKKIYIMRFISEIFESNRELVAVRFKIQAASHGSNRILLISLLSTLDLRLNRLQTSRPLFEILQKSMVKRILIAAALLFQNGNVILLSKGQPKVPLQCYLNMS